MISKPKTSVMQRKIYMWQLNVEIIQNGNFLYKIWSMIILRNWSLIYSIYKNLYMKIIQHYHMYKKNKVKIFMIQLILEIIHNGNFIYKLCRMIIIRNLTLIHSIIQKFGQKISFLGCQLDEWY